MLSIKTFSTISEQNDTQHIDTRQMALSIRKLSISILSKMSPRIKKLNVMTLSIMSLRKRTLGMALRHSA